VSSLTERDSIYLLNNKDKLKNALNEARSLKLPEQMWRDIQALFDQTQWRDECDMLWWRVTDERAEWWSDSSSSSNEDGEESSDDVKKPTNIKELEKLVIEGKKKGYNCDKMYGLWDRVETYVAKVSDVF
jgi:hypothetical protein